MKYVTALKDYNHKQTRVKVITKGMIYMVYKENKNEYFIIDNNGKKLWVDKNLFKPGMCDLV